MFKIASIMMCFFCTAQFFLYGKQTQRAIQIVESNAPTFQLNKVSGMIRIDGYLNEKAWEDALVVDLNNEIYPAENIEAKVKTKCFITYDEKNLYVGFKAYDPDTRQIRANLSDRDNITQDDLLGFMIDTFNDQNRAFAFWVNPLGIQSDLIVSNGGTSEDSSWDAIWDSAGRICSDGYEVEFAIPFNMLQFPRNTFNQTWGFIPLRIYPRNLRHQFSNIMLNRSNYCLLCQFNHLTGLKGISPNSNIELDPALTAVRTDERGIFSDEPLKKKDAKMDVGISGRWNFTSNLTLNATVNPDFSQVEADILQLDINKQFTLYYAEKRPFFLEGKDFFSTPIDAVYTRNLVEPSWGVKVSGKEGKNALGFFISRDEITNLLFPGVEGSKYTTLNQASTASVLRYRRDIGLSSTVGILFTDREGNDYYNRLAGVDGLIWLTRSDTIRFQALGTSTRYPIVSAEKFHQKDRRMSGYGIDVSYRRETRNYGWRLNYENFSPDFRADMGFVSRVSYWKGLVGGSYIYWGNNRSFISHIRIDCDLFLAKDHRGRPLERQIELGTVLEMPLQSHLSIYAGKQEKMYNYREFNLDFLTIGFQLFPSRTFYLSCFADIRHDIDYANTRPGKYFYIAPSMNCNIGKHLLASISYSYSHMNIEQGRLFRTHLAQCKLLYHFSNRAFLRSIIQYEDIFQDPALYKYVVDQKEQKFFMQFLFSYKINPRTVLFLGYSDNYEGLLDVPLKQTNRTFFLKIGYALSI